jgi:hypothetical protein
LVTVYVYYRVSADALPALAPALEQAIAPLGGELSRRADEAGNHITLMERYALADEPSADWLGDMHRRMSHVLSGHLIGERHAEVFVKLPAPR